MNADDLFTAPQVAKICSTDLKTIHNWVNRSEIRSFRTPGRHLRFRRQDVLDFLVRYGYPIPEGFAPARRRVVILDSSEDAVRSLKRTLSRDWDIEAYCDTVDALLAIGSDQPSLVLVNADESDNLHVVERLAATKDGAPVACYGTVDLNGKAKELGAVEHIPSADGKEIRKQLSEILGK